MKLLISILPLILVIGCGPKVKPSEVADTGKAIERVAAHNESQGRLIDAAAPHADSTGKEFLVVAKKENAAVNKAATEAKKESAELEASYTKVYNSLGYKAQRAIVKLLWIGGLSWLAFGIVGAWLAPHWIGRTILNLLPVSNIFSEVARRK